MDLFQTLRKIQKKERGNGTLAHVEETFYDDIHEYLNELKQSAIDDPFSDVYNTLNEARRIATEICERREHKITSAAVLNIHRSYHLFTGKSNFDLVDSMPVNLTPEEEKFYFSLIETLKNHRQNLSNDEKAALPKKDFSSSDLEKNTADEESSSPSPDVIEKSNKNISLPADKSENDLTLDKSHDDSGNAAEEFDKISKAKIIKNEKREPIEKQIGKSRSDLDVMHDDENQFIDLDSQKRIHDSEIVTMLIFENIDSIVGIDEKVYGPFRPQDIVMLPRINANIFAKSRKGRFVKL